MFLVLVKHQLQHVIAVVVWVNKSSGKRRNNLLKKLIFAHDPKWRKTWCGKNKYNLLNFYLILLNYLIQTNANN